MSNQKAQLRIEMELTPRLTKRTHSRVRPSKIRARVASAKTVKKPFSPSNGLPAYGWGGWHNQVGDLGDLNKEEHIKVVYKELSAKGICYCRVGLNMSTIMEVKEGGEVHFNWDKVKTVVETANEYNTLLLPILFDQTPEGQPKSLVGIEDNKTKVFLRFVREAVERYGPQTNSTENVGIPIEVWEIWNEPNVNVTPLSIEQYTALFKRVHSVIKSIHGDARVLSGGIAARTKKKRDFDYLKGMLDVIDHLVDGVSVHIYPKKASSELKSTLLKIRRVVRKRARRAQIWLTEFGWGSGPTAVPTYHTAAKERRLSEGAQAIFMAKALDILASLRGRWKKAPRLGPVFWFGDTDQDVEMYRVDKEKKEVKIDTEWNYYGLWDKEGRKKRALTTFEDRARKKLRIKMPK